MDRFPQYGYLGRRAAGGRVRFQTDAKELYVKMTLAGTKEDINIPLSGLAGADIYLGKGIEATYLGYIARKIHTEGEITVEKTFDLSGEAVLVTINLPRNDHLLRMQIGIEESTKLGEAPTYIVDRGEADRILRFLDYRGRMRTPTRKCLYQYRQQMAGCGLP